VQRGDLIIDLSAPPTRIMPLVRILALQMEAANAAGEATEALDLATVLVAVRDLAAHEVSLINYLVSCHH
jgi:hypothetical protein